MFDEVDDYPFDDLAIVKMGPPMDNIVESVVSDDNSNDTPVETQRQITTSDSE